MNDYGRALNQAHNLTTLEVGDKVAFRSRYHTYPDFYPGEVVSLTKTQVRVRVKERKGVVTHYNFMRGSGKLVGEDDSSYHRAKLCRLEWAEEEARKFEAQNAVKMNRSALSSKLQELAKITGADNFLEQLDAIRAEYVDLKAKSEV